MWRTAQSSTLFNDCVSLFQKPGTFWQNDWRYVRTRKLSSCWFMSGLFITSRSALVDLWTLININGWWIKLFELHWTGVVPIHWDHCYFVSISEQTPEELRQEMEERKRVLVRKVSRVFYIQQKNSRRYKM